MDEAAEAGAKIIVFPELCITGYTCSDLFLQDILLNSAKKALAKMTFYFDVFSFIDHFLNVFLDRKSVV